MRKLAGLLVAVLLLPVVARAQSTIPEAEYWRLVQATQTDLQTALNAEGSDRESVLTQNRWRWQDVGRVALANRDESITVDVRWLQPPPSADAALIQTTLDRIDALQQYRASQGNADGLPLSALNQTLPEENPPQDTFDFRVNPNVQAILRVLMIAVGILAVIAVLFAIARGLQLTIAFSKSEQSTANETEDPQTSDEAQNLATSSEQAKDYRTAVRYLYLSSLLMLDEHGLLRYDPSQTNQEHLTQIDDNLRAVLAPIINFFDRTWYGFAPISADDYRRFRRQVDRLNQLATQRQS